MNYRTPKRATAIAIALLACSTGSVELASAQTRNRVTAPRAAAVTAVAAATAVAPAGSATAAPAAAAPLAGTLRELNLTQLGIDYAIKLRGISGTVGIPFSVRADELITGASLRLNYAYSPALIPELSHIKVSVNNVLLSTLPADKANAGKPLTADIPIDRRLITDFNRIDLELVGHYTRDCEDPVHTSLWATIDASTTLRLNVAPLNTVNDLAVLPQPFFDRRDVRRLKLPFVFGNATATQTLEAAGIVSSWFGALAGYRGATFPVSNGDLPLSNAVVFALPDAMVPGVSMPSIQGPGLAVVDHPQDPNFKLLIVSGRTPAELRTAASALALNNRALSGATAGIPEFEMPAARKPYDAPRWISSDRPVQLGELSQASEFSVAGYTPNVIRLNMQLPPDLFTWRSRGIPLDLQYRYTPRVRADQSTLNLSANDTFISSLPLRTAFPTGDHWWNPLSQKLLNDGTVPERKEVLLPTLAVGSRAQLQMHYYFEPPAGKCLPLLENVRGGIDPVSTIDVSHFPHYIAMPELAAFANSGFPFSRLADLADTAVVLPDQPEASDTEAYLAIMGQLGNATGFPALRVTVGRSSNIGQLADKDLLVVGNLQNQPLFTQWAAQMPLKRNNTAQQYRFGTWVDEALNFVTGTRKREDLPSSAQISIVDDGEDAVIAGFESPLRSQRSVVAVVATAKSQPSLVNALMTPDLIKRVQGSMSLVRGTQVSSVLTGDTYYVGRLPPVAWLQWNLSRSPIILIIGAVLIALIGSAAAYASLQLRARKRLQQ
ncbi:cellulose biosynthesis cyclic di-GMP-binding regulatory protein BcsB [soil metagenome]